MMHRDVLKQVVLPTQQPQDLQRDAWQLASPGPAPPTTPPPHPQQVGCPPLSHSADQGAQRQGVPSPCGVQGPHTAGIPARVGGTHIHGVDLPEANLPPAPQA